MTRGEYGPTRDQVFTNLRVSEECDSISNELLPVSHVYGEGCECERKCKSKPVGPTSDFESCDPNLCVCVCTLILTHIHFSPSDTFQCCASSLPPSRPVLVGPTCQSVIKCHSIPFVSHTSFLAALSRTFTVSRHGVPPTRSLLATTLPSRASLLRGLYAH